MTWTQRRAAEELRDRSGQVAPSRSQKRRTPKNLATGRFVWLIESGLQLDQKNVRRVATSALATLLVFLLLWTTAFALTSSHQQTHSAGRSPEHHPCAVCLFAHGQVLSSEAGSASVCTSTGLLVTLLPTCAFVPLEFDCRLPQGRAPPLSFS